MAVIIGVVPEGDNLISSQKGCFKKALFGSVFKNYSDFCSPSDPGFQIQFWQPFSFWFQNISVSMMLACHKESTE